MKKEVSNRLESPYQKGSDMAKKREKSKREPTPRLNFLPNDPSEKKRERYCPYCGRKLNCHA